MQKAKTVSTAAERAEQGKPFVRAVRSGLHTLPRRADGLELTRKVFYLTTPKPTYINCHIQLTNPSDFGLLFMITKGV
jgi:hypothetical protein